MPKTDPQTTQETPEVVVLQPYVCDRCGFKYEKSFDYPPYLCYRCMRFIAKRVWTTIKTITPPVSRPVVSDLT